MSTEVETSAEQSATEAAVETLGQESIPNPFQNENYLQAEDLGYRPIAVIAPFSLVLGLVSLAGLATPYAMVLPVLGTIFSLFGLWQIRRSNGELGGFWLIVPATVLSLSFLISGASWQTYTYLTEVPEGYGRMSFRWVSQCKPIVRDGVTELADEPLQLDGKKVFVKGYMYPQREQSNLKTFVLCKDTGQCCFGGNPALTDLIVVDFVNSTRATHRELQLVNVAGTFRAKKIVHAGQVVALYKLEAEYFK